MKQPIKSAWKRRVSKVLISASVMSIVLSGVITQPGVAQAYEPIIIDSQSTSEGANNIEFTKKEIVWSDGERFNGDGLFDGGDGSYENPYLISSRDQLELLHQDATGNTHYKLTADINLSGEEWTPIPQFAGSIDGDGHAIVGMTISGGMENAGFIAKSINGKDIEIRNLEYRDASVLANSEKAAIVLGSVPKNERSVIVSMAGVKVSGSVETSHERGQASGVIGNIDSYVNPSTNEEKFHALNAENIELNISVNGCDAAGVASGFIENSFLRNIKVKGNITSRESAATGVVDAAKNSLFKDIEVDALIEAGTGDSGDASGIGDKLFNSRLENIKVVADFSGNDVSGIANTSIGNTTEMLSVEGTIEGKSNASGAFGLISGGSMRSLFVSGRISSEGEAAGVTGAFHDDSSNSLEVEKQVFEDIRVHADVISKNGQASGIAEGVFPGDNEVSFDGVEFIGTVESELGRAGTFAWGVSGSEAAILKMTNVNVQADITSRTFQASGLAHDMNYVDLSNVMIDGSVFGEQQASGLVGGMYNDNRITGVKANVVVNGGTSSVTSGLFKFIGNSEVRDIEIDATVNGEGTAGLIGHIDDNVIIDGVSGTTTVHAKENAFGLTNYLGESDLVNVNLNSNVLSETADATGGVMIMPYGTMSNIRGNYYVNGKGQSSGLVDGLYGGKVEDVDIVAEVTGNVNVGGLAANGSAGEMRNVNIVTTVSGKINVGGVVGLAPGVKLENVLVGRGSKVQGTENVGGVVGYFEDGSNIHTGLGSLAQVTGSHNVGGIAGFLSANLQESFALGRIQGQEKVGGFAGDSRNPEINNAYADAVVIGDDIVGGLLGGLDGGKVNHVYAAGLMKVTGSGAGLIGTATGDFSVDNAFSLNDQSNKKLPLYFGKVESFSEDQGGSQVEYVQEFGNFASWNAAENPSDKLISTELILFNSALSKPPYEAKNFKFTEDSGPWKVIHNRTLPYFSHPVYRNSESNKPIDPEDPDGGIYPNNPDEGDVTDPGDGGDLKPCPDVRSIEVYVHVAELSKRDPHITNAIKKIEALPDCEEKAAFEERIHAIYEWLEQYEYELFLESVEKNLDWAGKYEREPYLSAVGDKVGGVKDPDKQDEIQGELDSIYAGMTEREKAAALKNATTLVGFAERYEREPYLSRAEEALKATPPSDEKTALEARFNAVMDKLGQAEEERKLAAATEAVEKAETAESIFAIEDAQALVDELKDGSDKDALTNRLAAIEITDDMLAVYELKLSIAGITDAEAKPLFEQAYQAIETAESEGSRHTAAADEAMAALEPYATEEATDEVLKGLVGTLTEYLDSVKRDQAVQLAATDAENAVSTAERYARDMYVTRAETALANLKELDPEYDTAELEARLQVVRDKVADAAQAANIANAEKQIGYAERYKRDPYLSRAQAAIDVLPDSETKTALQERLDAVMN